MRVAFISYDFGEYSIRHANALANEAEVLLALGDGVAKGLERRLAEGVEFFPFPKPRLRQPIRQLGAVRKILRRVREFSPDVIHFQGGHLWFNLALPQLRQYPLTLTVHNPRHHLGDRNSRRTPQWVMDYGYRQADQIIVHGEQLRRETHTDLGFPLEKIHVIPHIAMGTWTASTATAAESKRRILFFGRIWEYKGLEYLIRAEPLIREQVSDVEIVIAGEGEDFQRYRDLMARPDKFRVHNAWISNEQRAEFFSEAAIVVLPYVEATQSGVVPIAYAHGKPVVATHVGSLPECVDDGRTGLLVPPRDEHALAQALIRLLQDDELRREMGSAGRKKLDEECSDEVIAAKHLEVYRRAVQARQRPAGAALKQI